MGLYILSIFLSAFLLFQIQPLIGKFLLPWFGGTSGVWSTILLFFQTLLTGGYAYAYWLVGNKRSPKPIIFHFVGLVISLVLFTSTFFSGGSPLAHDVFLRPNQSQVPVWEIIKILTIFIGFPGFILSANSTLIQTWFNRDYPKKSPYWLYSLSNVGSLLALVTYPLLFEPNLSLKIQAWVWSSGFLIFFLTTCYLIIKLIRSSAIEKIQAENKKLIQEIQRIPSIHQLMWVGLSATASILLLSTTNQLTQEVAPVPLLWVLPLGIYLLSFIVCFSGENRYQRPLYIALLTISSVGIIYVMESSYINFFIQVIIYLIFLFSACMIAHGELFRLRPGPSRLSKFYLMVSVGGAVGGILVNLIAPFLFNGYWEFYLGWILIFILLIVLIYIQPSPKQKMLWRRRLSYGIVIQALIFLIFSLNEILNPSGYPLYQERNFYGVSKVVYSEYRDAYQYVNGTTVHGFQLISQEDRSVPTAYFWRGSGIAMMIRNHPKYENQMKVGVLGLGIGTLAAHGHPGDRYRFYEINPDVIALALGQGDYFSFLEDSLSETTLVPGDARISLERELNQGQIHDFDLLVMDAFSSDSVPVHLITLEAFELYLKHLSPGGVIAVNISNNYIDLKPVIWKLSRELELSAIYIDPAIQDYHPIGVRSRWMFLSKDPIVFDTPEINANADFLKDYHTNIRLWTDDYSNLFSILQ